MSASDKFWSKVQVGGLFDCWAWRGGKQSGGYGALVVGSRTDGSRRVVLAHRWSYEYAVGPIEGGLDIDHLCRNRACVNPLHLEPVTHRVNCLRGVSPCAIHAQKTHCPHGHPYDAVTRRGSRLCRVCRRAGRRQEMPV